MGNLNRFKAKNGVDGNSLTITNVADPVNAQDAATKNFCANISNATTGTLSVSRGGTGATTLTGMLRASGTSPFSAMTGATNYVTKWTDATSIGNSLIYDSGTNIGIGIAPAGWRLHISSTLTGTTPRSNIILRVQSEATGRDACIQLSDNVTNAAEVGMVSGHLYFATSGVERARIDSNGNVGVGSAAPGRKLDVEGDGRFVQVQAATTGAITLRQNVGDTVGAHIQWVNNANTVERGWLVVDTSSNMIFATQSSERMRINAAGNVGIGTSSPGTKLTVQTGVAGNLAHFTDGINADFLIKTSSLLTTIGPNAGSTNLLLQTGGVERARIDANGDIMLGTTAVQNNARLSIVQSNGSGSVALCTRTNDNVYYPAIFLNTGGSPVGYINCTQTTTNYNTSSDYRLKENIAPMTGALEKVAALKPVTYTWRADGTLGQGFIAHELQEVIPDAVTGEKDAVDREGNPKYQGVDTSFLVATLTAAIQELKQEFKAELDSAKARIAELEAKQNTQ